LGQFCEPAPKVTLPITLSTASAASRCSPIAVPCKPRSSRPFFMAWQAVVSQRQSTAKHSKAGNCVACGVCSRCLSPNCREPGNHPRVKGEHSAKIKALYREDYHNAAVTVVRRGEDRQQAISPSLNEDILFAPITEAMVQAEERDRPPTPSNLLERLFNCLRESFDNLAHTQQHRAASFTLEQLRSNVSSRRDALTMATSALETLLLGITGSDEAARLELEPRCGNAHQFVLFLRVTWPWTNSPTFS